MLQFGGLRFVSLLFLFSYCWSDTIGTGYPYDPICLRQIPSNNSRPWRNPPPEERLLYVSRDHVDQDTNEWLIFERDDGSTKMGVITSVRTRMSCSYYVVVAFSYCIALLTGLFVLYFSGDIMAVCVISLFTFVGLK